MRALKAVFAVVFKLQLFALKCLRLSILQPPHEACIVGGGVQNQKPCDILIKLCSSCSLRFSREVPGEEVIDATASPICNDRTLDVEREEMLCQKAGLFF